MPPSSGSHERRKRKRKIIHVWTTITQTQASTQEMENFPFAWPCVCISYMWTGVTQPKTQGEKYSFHASRGNFVRHLAILNCACVFQRACVCVLRVNQPLSSPMWPKRRHIHENSFTTTRRKRNNWPRFNSNITDAENKQRSVISNESSQNSYSLFVKHYRYILTLFQFKWKKRFRPVHSERFCARLKETLFKMAVAHLARSRFLNCDDTPRKSISLNKNSSLSVEILNVRNSGWFSAHLSYEKTRDRARQN